MARQRHAALDAGVSAAAPIPSWRLPGETTRFNSKLSITYAVFKGMGYQWFLLVVKIRLGAVLLAKAEVFYQFLVAADILFVQVGQQPPSLANQSEQAEPRWNRCHHRAA